MPPLFYVAEDEAPGLMNMRRALPPPARGLLANYDPTWWKQRASEQLAPGHELREGPAPTARDYLADWLGGNIGGDATHARTNYQAADALSLLPFVGAPMAAFEGGQMVGQGLNEASPTGVAGGAAIAGFGPFAKLGRGKKAAQSLDDEIAKLESELQKVQSRATQFQYRSGGAQIAPIRPRPQPVPGTSAKEIAADDVRYRDRLKSRISDFESMLASAAAKTPNPFHPVPTPAGDPQTIAAAARMREKIGNNPYVQAIPGRRGFPSKDEQRQLAEQVVLHHFGGLPPKSGGPWGDLHTAGLSEDDIKMLADMYARMSQLPKP